MSGVRERAGPAGGAGTDRVGADRTAQLPTVRGPSRPPRGREQPVGPVVR